MSEYKPTIKLPTKEELYSETPTTYETEDRLFGLLNMEPKAEWIKELKFGVNIYRYVPIEKCELMANRIFGAYNVEIRRELVTFNGNGVVVIVRFHYWDRVMGAMMYQDGVGAMKLSRREDLQTAFPVAASIAQRNAMRKLGRCFGKYLNRDIEEEQLSGEEPQKEVTLDDKKVEISLKVCKTIAEVEEVRERNPDHNAEAFTKRIEEIKKNKKQFKKPDLQ